jgi:hypothetical protein
MRQQSMLLLHEAQEEGAWVKRLGGDAVRCVAPNACCSKLLT